MPTRKQRRRAVKERRHEYETVWVDGEGNELDEPPDEASARDTRTEGKPKSQAKSQPRGGRAGRIPPQPSWQRAARRSAILGVVIFVMFMLLNSKSSNRVESAALIAVLYTGLFIPFTYVIDRFAYRRYEKQQAGSRKR
jgi:hypothetical protein